MNLNRNRIGVVWTAFIDRGKWWACCQSNDLYGSIKCREILGKLSNWQLLGKGSA
jgi:hypothetical protein